MGRGIFSCSDELLDHLDRNLKDQNQKEDKPNIIRDAVRKQRLWALRTRSQLRHFLWFWCFTTEYYRWIEYEMGPSKELMLRIIKAKREGKVEVSQVVLNWMMEGEHQYQSQLWSEHAD
jgi:hypothetical protein